MTSAEQRRIVVVGAGMAAARLVEGLVARGLGPQVTVLGKEHHAPYNRILLSAVLEGTHAARALTLRDPAWFAEHGVDLRLGVRVVGIDRDAREVETVDDLGVESRVAYTELVLATGLIPKLPPIRGVVDRKGHLHPKVHAFRTMADCRDLLAVLPDAKRAVVVGGGLLGLQVARALAGRGIATEIVEGSEHLMSRQLSAPGGRALARDLRRLGTSVYTGSRAVRLTDEGLVLDNGFTLSTNLVVLTAGGRPAMALARDACLTVRRGVVVDSRLASVDDPAIHAIGDCAEFVDADGVSRTTGFVSPAWEQAALLAEILAGEARAYRGSRSVARLRATDLDVAVLGEPEEAVADERTEVVEISNPLAGSYRKLVVRHGVIVAATLVGDLSHVGLITQHYDRGTRLGPDEPGALLLPPRPTAPTQLHDSTEICSCAGVSAGEIRACSSLEQVVESTRATTGCGGCKEAVCQLLEQKIAPVPSG
ncbi:FAD-dependent oxidoreductase [Nocardioides jishulii]|uniref:NAD(P)/FAD-dependent oxidoreductase n=1 Tax=Nocardioides jishulii TaxID=2575440 RepID=A0A4U2YVX9_9ACTN|nr:FAD-dependent oxidoreductase [Nocardioides jishulii]QCX28802.1 NAD(P)/FAD-dependent oxidoreductase [Nocardioides jishulii]TKI64301.1 NAD(P)/FAD-dependent oxidoreductase [Nocardioides jishulii]